MTSLATPAAVAIALFALGTMLAWDWWRDGTPVQVTTGGSMPLPCISYAPSQQSGHERDSLTDERLRRDLALLSQRTRCVRTYTVSEGFDRVPVVAREFGMQVLLGLWIARDDAHNERELATGIRVAREYRDAIRAVVVGNEVLLRHEQTPAQLAAMLRRVADATGLPVTYADVWGYWSKHAALARDVDFVTVHILPYWDDDPIDIARVLPYVERLHARLQRKFSGKPLFVGETGWPTAGRPRGPVETGRVNQARFLAGFDALARRHGFDYNVIEAFDQPWKIAHEGTVGGHWGLYDASGRPKLRADGTVVEDEHGHVIALVALLCGLLAATAAVLRPQSMPASARPSDRWSLPLAACGLGAFAVAVAARQWRYVLDGNLHGLELMAALAVLTLGWAAFALLVRAVVGHRRADSPAFPRVVGLGLLAAAAYVCLGLVFAGRHRDFPVWVFLPGVVAITWAALLQGSWTRRGRAFDEEAMLAAWLVLAGIVIAVMERCGSLRALGWSSMCVLLGFAVWQQSRDQHRARDDAQT